ncbi:MAG: PHP domain-containing protein [Phototrophicaceae bacterium]
MTTLWNVDLHSHTYWSKDSLTRFEQIIRLCQQRGVDKIAITDHNTADSALAFQRLAPQLVIVGEEIFTTEGEILGYFMQATIPPGLTPEATIARLREQGAIVSVAHPFDRHRKGAWEEAALRRILPLVDAIEVFNARSLLIADNHRARAFAQANGVCGTVGSDGHFPEEYGRATLQMMPFQNAEEFRRALQTATPKTAMSSPVVHVYSKAAKWSRKLGITQQPTVG